MNSDDTYTFRISAYTPETIPMARLAEYMSELAAIFGEKERVHFSGLKTGSTVLLSRVESEASPKVRDNVNNININNQNSNPSPYKKLNEMLRKDNAEAELMRDGSKVLNFPGIKTPRPPKLGPFNQSVTKDGVLVRVGGKDKSAHATIEDSDGCTWSFEVSRDLAKNLAHHLFGKHIRIIGQGRWFRNEEGIWEYTNLKAIEFKLLDESSLADIVKRVRNLPSETWNHSLDPIETIRLLRDDGNGVH